MKDFDAATFRFPHCSVFSTFLEGLTFLIFKKIAGGGGNRTRVLIREIQMSTGLAVYSIVRAGLAKRRAACSYPGLSYLTVSGSNGRASPDCDAEVVPQSGGTVPRNYAAKA